MEVEPEEEEEDVWIKIFSYLTNYFNYELRCNGFFFARNNLPRIKDGAYVINHDDENSTGTHFVSLFIDRNTAVYFDSFGIEYIPQEALNKIKD